MGKNILHMQVVKFVHMPPLSLVLVDKKIYLQMLSRLRNIVYSFFSGFVNNAQAFELGTAMLC